MYIPSSKFDNIIDTNPLSSVSSGYDAPLNVMVTVWPCSGVPLISVNVTLNSLVSVVVMFKSVAFSIVGISITGS